MWKFLDEVAKPSLDAASDLSRLVSSFARYIADLLCADIVSVDQRIDRDTFEPIAVFTSSDRKVHKPGQPPYIYPVEAVGARQLRAATANDGAPHPQNPTWAVVRSMQVWQVGETSERLRADLGQSYSAWSKLLIDRGLRYALAVPVFDLGGLWGQVIVGRALTMGPFVDGDRLGVAFLVEVFSHALNRLEGRPHAAPRQLSVAQLTAEAQALRLALRAQSESRPDDGRS